ncbi:hypothetical protein GXN76_12315 [Kroppenstedtia pulmonis]|uniref:Uncharacterized protein n=1 Tax=Kroppenstedtia pulmonis TaxID=1380685 RepID=A0A7D4CWP0_9BACL|nr:hypothetical protein [Kroppenstedtia pulmonis]QKG85177.1 hypothetical protein GXN76_12315 [Kroppenstedtia pulmonis]
MGRCRRRRHRHGGGCGCDVVIDANPRIKTVAGVNAETGAITAAILGDIEQTAVESGPGNQIAKQLSNNRF